MDLSKIYKPPKIPMKFTFSGDKDRSKSLINFAKQQVTRMLISNEANKFNKLSTQIQHKRMSLPSGESIEIQFNHGLTIVNINSPVTSVSIEEIPEITVEKIEQELGMVNVSAATSYYLINETAWNEDLALWNSYGGASALALSAKLLVQSVDDLTIVAPYGLPEGLQYVAFSISDDVDDSWTNLQYWTERVGSEILEYAPTYQLKVYSPGYVSGGPLFTPSIRSDFMDWLDTNGLLYFFTNYTSGVFIPTQQRWLQVLANNAYWTL